MGLNVFQHGVAAEMTDALASLVWISVSVLHVSIGGAVSNDSSLQDAVQRNIFGERLSPCYFGAPGHQGSCPFGGTGSVLDKNTTFCVQPASTTNQPFCIPAEQFGRYLALEPAGSTAGELRAKCTAVPKEALDSDFATVHLGSVLSKSYLSVANHLCLYCPLEGLLAPGPGKGCRAVATSRYETVTTTTSGPLEAQSESGGKQGGPHLQMPSFSFGHGAQPFWIFAAMAMAAWFAYVFCVLRDDSGAVDSESTGSEDELSTRHLLSEKERADNLRKREAQFVGAWEMLGQIQLITATQIRWQDRKVSKIHAISPSAFELTTGGRTEMARLDSEGQNLLWSNGAVWLRVEEGTPLLS